MASLPCSHYYIADKGGSSSCAFLVLSGWLTSAHVLPQQGPGSILSAISGKGLIMVPYLLHAKEGTFPSPMPPHGIWKGHDLLFHSYTFRDSSPCPCEQSALRALLWCPGEMQDPLSWALQPVRGRTSSPLGYSQWRAGSTLFNPILYEILNLHLENHLYLFAKQFLYQNVNWVGSLLAFCALIHVYICVSLYVHGPVYVGTCGS